MLGLTETRTHDRINCQTMRTVRDISRDDRARIATCRLRTLTDRQTDRLKENYSIDGGKLYRFFTNAWSNVRWPLTFPELRISQHHSLNDRLVSGSYSLHGQLAEQLTQTICRRKHQPRLFSHYLRCVTKKKINQNTTNLTMAHQKSVKLLTDLEVKYQENSDFHFST